MGAKTLERFWNNPQGIVLGSAQEWSRQRPTVRRQLGLPQTSRLTSCLSAPSQG